MPIYLQHGNLIDYVPPTDTSTEDVVFMGGLVGIPQAFIQAGELGALSVDGVYMFNKKDGVSVNLGEVVKYCGTTKLAQDSNADLTLGVAVADAEADDFGVKVKINSVLPTDGGGGGGGEVAIDTTRGLSENSCGIGINIGTGLSFGSCGELTASGGGGGGGGDGIQNLATGEGSLSILGMATTSSRSTSVGYYASADGNESIAIGADSSAIGCYSTALGAYTYAGDEGSTTIGHYASADSKYSNAIGTSTNANEDYSTALGYGAYADDVGVTVISAWNDDGNAKTQLYLIGAGSTLSTTYCDGEAGLGFVSKDSSNNIIKRGTIKLSAIMTENTNTFNPSW